MLERLAAADVGVAAWEIISDIGVLAYACRIMNRPDPSGRRPVAVDVGYGCHLSPPVALARALTEAIQIRV